MVLLVDRPSMRYVPGGRSGTYRIERC